MGQMRKVECTSKSEGGKEGRDVTDRSMYPALKE